MIEVAFSLQSSVIVTFVTHVAILTTRRGLCAVVVVLAVRAIIVVGGDTFACWIVLDDAE